METVTVREVGELEAVAVAVLPELAQKAKACAAVLALSGDLGAGKTTFTQVLARALGVTEPVISPTFVIMKGYALEHADFDTLIHIDAYRLESPEELAVLGFARILAEPRTLVVLEWPERVRELVPVDRCWLTLTDADGVRTITPS